MEASQPAYHVAAILPVLLAAAARHPVLVGVAEAALADEDGIKPQ